MVKPSVKRNAKGEQIKPLRPDQTIAKREWHLNRRQAHAIEAAREGITGFDVGGDGWNLVWAKVSITQIIDQQRDTELFPFRQYEPDQPSGYLVPLDEPISDKEIERFRKLLGFWIMHQKFYGDADYSPGNMASLCYFTMLVEGMQSALAARDALLRAGKPLPVAWQGLNSRYVAARERCDEAARLEAFEQLMATRTECAEALFAKRDAMETEGRRDFTAALAEVGSIVQRRALHA